MAMPGTKNTRCAISFKEYVKRDQEKNGGLQRRGQNFKTEITESAFRIGRAPADADRHQRDDQRHHISQHMRGVRQQCEAAGNDAADDFRYEVSRRQRQRNLKLAGVGGSDAACVPFIFKKLAIDRLCQVW
jgi:hypothetical protein